MRIFQSLRSSLFLDKESAQIYRRQTFPRMNIYTMKLRRNSNDAHQQLRVRENKSISMRLGELRGVELPLAKNLC
jgi:hypothetical protein